MMTQRLRHALIIMLIAALPPATNANSVPDAHTIVMRSDQVRNPPGSYRMSIDITDYQQGRVSDEMRVTVYSKPEESSGLYRTLVDIEAPRKDRGKLILRNAQDLWFYDPAAKSSVRISPQQRLLGQVSNGDVMSSNFAKDYQSQLLGIESIRDASKTQRECYLLALESTNDRVTYPKIRYWVSTDHFYPIKGEFFSHSGQRLKVAYYRAFESVLGATRPTEVLILDAVDRKKVTRMRFDTFEHLDIADHWFQRSWLPRHQSQP